MEQGSFPFLNLCNPVLEKKDTTFIVLHLEVLRLQCDSKLKNGESREEALLITVAGSVNPSPSCALDPGDH